ncbi:MAG TPA: hypothetical protein VKB90_01300 [Candidatus Acidoferrum sp.]|nr:hypothetical protein [Candidatus Acidoferrum sp.]
MPRTPHVLRMLQSPLGVVPEGALLAAERAETLVRELRVIPARALFPTAFSYPAEQSLVGQVQRADEGQSLPRSHGADHRPVALAAFHRDAPQHRRDGQLRYSHDASDEVANLLVRAELPR